MTRLVIVRHGETAWNAEHRVQGQLDVPLNAFGRQQAQAVARILGQEKFHALYCSDLGRTRETMAPTAAALGMDVTYDAGLRERHYGMFQTHTYADVKVKYAAEYARFAARDPDFDFGSGESLRAFYRRAVDCVAGIARRHPDQDVLIVTHGGVLEMVYREVMGLTMSQPREFGIPNCGINRLVAGTPWRVEAWAVVAHLESALDDLVEPTSGSLTSRL